jgi:integrase
MEQLTEFLEEYKGKQGVGFSKRTREEYVKAFAKFEAMFGTCDFKTLFTEEYDRVYEELSKHASSFYLGKVNGFCKYYDIPYIQCVSKSPEPICAIDPSDFRNKVVGIDDLKARALLSISLDSSGNSLRADWANTMVVQYASKIELENARSTYDIETRTFHTLSDNKTGRARTFQMSEETNEVIKEYLDSLKDKRFVYSTKSVDPDKRCNNYCKYIKSASTKYLETPVNVNGFRKGLSTEEFDKVIQSGQDIPKQLLENASKRGHSLQTELKHYIGKVQKSESEEPDPESAIQKLIRENSEYRRENSEYRRENSEYRRENSEYRRENNALREALGVPLGRPLEPP